MVTMMTKRIAILDAEGTVINVALYPDDFIPNEVTHTAELPSMRIGDTVVGGVHTNASPPVPESVTKLQLVRAMRISGIWGTFKSMLKQSPTETKEDWEYVSVLDRDDDLTIAFGTELGLDTAGMDSLFVSAETL